MGHKRPSKRTTALSRRVLPAPRPVLLVVGPVLTAGPMGRVSRDRILSIAAYGHSRGYAPVVPELARQEWVMGPPDEHDDSVSSIARCLGLEGARFWILGPLDDVSTSALLSYGGGFTVGKYRVPIARPLDPLKPERALSEDVAIGEWASWHAVIATTESGRALLERYPLAVLDTVPE